MRQLLRQLSRISQDTYLGVSIKRKFNEDPVIAGLSYTPSMIEALARQGTPVSVPNADQFISLDSGLDVPPELKVDADRNSLWEESKRAKARILKARKYEHENLT